MTMTVRWSFILLAAVLLGMAIGWFCNWWRGKA